MSKTIIRQIYAETAPFTLWDLYNNDLEPYNLWNIEWFKNFNYKESFEMWDNEDWLQELYDGSKKHKKEFKKFTQKNFPLIDHKTVYKEFKEIWELKDELDKLATTSSLKNELDYLLPEQIKKLIEDVASSPANVTMEPTTELRYKEKILQQLWIDKNTGDVEWRLIKEE